MTWYGFIQKYFGLFFAAGIIAGLLFSARLIFIAEGVMLILGTVMTLLFLVIDLREIFSHLKSFHRIVAVQLITKAVIPFLLYYAFQPFGDAVALGALLLSLTPFAAVSPTLTRILGGDTEFILINQILMTLLSPLLMPLLILLIAGTRVELNVPAMMKTLVYLIFIPFIVSLILRPLIPGLIDRTKRYYGGATILLIALLITGLMAKAAAPIKANPAAAVPLALTAILLGFVLCFSGWFAFFFLDKRKRIGLAVGNLYMNIGVTAVIAAAFFSEGTLLFVLLYELPANILPQLLMRLPFMRLPAQDQ